MAYNSLSTSLIEPSYVYLEKNYAKSEHLNCFQKGLVKGAYLILAPTSMILCAIDIIIGIGGTAAVLLTCGKNRSICSFAFKRLKSSSSFFTFPLISALKIINLKANFTSGETTYIRYANGVKPNSISYEGDGFISDSVLPSLKNRARTYYNTESFLESQVASRLTYLVLACSSVVTRTIDGVLSIPATALSLLAGGRNCTFNNFAVRTLQAPAIIDDLAYCVIKFLNPKAGTN